MPPLPASVAAQLASAFVAAGVFGFTGAAFTRDLWFAIATVLAFWLGIFAPAIYVPFEAMGGITTDDVTEFVQIAFFVIPAHATLAAAVGIGFVKIFDIRQLIDVWLSGSGGDSDGEERTFPFIVLAIILGFVATLLLVGATYPTAFLYGLWVPSAVGTVAYTIFGIIFAFFALALIGLSILQYKGGTRFNDNNDYLSFVYALVFLFLTLVLYGLAAAFDASPSGTTSAWTTALFVIADIVALLMAWSAESRQVDADRQKSRFFALPGSTLVNLLRAFVFIALHTGLFWLWGCVERLNTMNMVFTMMAWPHFLLAYTIAGAVILLVYFPCCLCKWTNYEEERQQQQIATFKDVKDIVNPPKAAAAAFDVSTQSSSFPAIDFGRTAKASTSLVSILLSRGVSGDASSSAATTRRRRAPLQLEF